MNKEINSLLKACNTIKEYNEDPINTLVNDIQNHVYKLLLQDVDIKNIKIIMSDKYNMLKFENPTLFGCEIIYKKNIPENNIFVVNITDPFPTNIDLYFPNVFESDDVIDKEKE